MSRFARERTLLPARRRSHLFFDVFTIKEAELKPEFVTSV
jgi:hypothetical protein